MRLDEVGQQIRARLALGHVIRHECIGVPMPKLVFRLEQAHQLHVLEVAGRLQDLEPVLDGLAVLLFDGRKVRSRALALLGRCHGVFSRRSLSVYPASAARQTKCRWPRARR